VLGDRPALALALEESGVDPNRLPSVLKSAQAWIERLASRGEAATALGELIERVRLSRESLHLPLKLPLALTEPDDVERPVNLLLSRLVPMQMKRRGVEMRIVLDGRALELISGQVNSVDEIARREHLDKRSVRRLLRLGFLSPRIIEAIAEGHQPPDLTVFSLMRRVDLPLLWNAQEQALGLR
jgi:hypothetical protein